MTTTQTTTNQDLQRRREQAVPRGVASAYPIYAERAEGAELFDADGRRYIDFSVGIGTCNVGHGHPRVLEAAREQMAKLVHPAFQVVGYEPYVALAERLAAAAPGEAPKKAIFFSTGAEAVENAVKIARAHTGRHGIIAFTGGFHGRTMMTLALTGKVTPYKAAFGPLPGGVFHAPYPMTYRGITTERSLEALDLLFKADLAPDQVAAILIEPVLGEGGFYAAPTAFLQRLRALCDEHGIVLIADEVQSGFGRTGRLFAIEHSGVEPDLMTVAKSLANGFPLSGVVGKAEIMDAPAPGGLGGTYGGNPVACAAALAVLDVMEEEDLPAKAEALGERFRERFEALAAEPGMEALGDVRHVGAMCAIELVADRESREPAPALAAAVRQEALRRGLIVLACGLYGNAIRVLAPLNAGAAYDEGLDILEASIRAAVENTSA